MNFTEPDIEDELRRQAREWRNTPMGDLLWKAANEMSELKTTIAVLQRLTR